MGKVTKSSDPANHVAVFQETAIRRIWHGNEWWFSVIDVVAVLSSSNNANRYWSDLKRKMGQEAGSEQPYEKIVRLKLIAPDGKQRETDCANTETLFRIIQSIPSPKAESLKRWLAQVAEQSFARIVESGMTIAWSEMLRYLVRRIADRMVLRPAAHKHPAGRDYGFEQG